MNLANNGQIITFYSYKGGTGRSMALANVAWILASNGHKVLAVDWDLESPGLHRYFHPFLVDGGARSVPGVIDLVWDFSVAAMEDTADDDPDWVEQHAQIMRYAVSLDWDFAGDGTLDFVPAGKPGATYGLRVSQLNWDVLYERHGGGELFERLRQNMRAHYDYVLIDSRTGLSDTAGICTVALPDTVVNCFTMSTQSIDGAVMAGRSIAEQSKRSLRILPVPMRIEEAEKTKLEAGRDFARSALAEFVAGDAAAQEKYWSDIEVPYKPFYAYEEILATIGERPHQGATLLAAFERLTSVLTGGEVSRIVPIPELERRQWLREFERTRQRAPSDIFISHAEQDPMWAAWITFHLRNAGYRVVEQGEDLQPGADLRDEIAQTIANVAHVVAILTPDYVESPQGRIAWDSALAREQTGEIDVLLPVRVTQFRPQDTFASRVYVDLVGRNADEARQALLAGLHHPTEPRNGAAAAADSLADGPRFPGEEPAVFQVPLRNPTFVGRDDLLVEIRSQLTSQTRATVLPQALHGLGGVGKTEVAIEYAHRFAADYDLVWWIPAEQVARARTELGLLAPRLGITPGSDLTETVRLVLDALRRGEPFRRWLLVFDNADDAEAIQQLLPRSTSTAETGHILITSRNQDWANIGDTVTVDVFKRQESIELLARRGKGISEEDADRLAARLGDLPLAIEQAAAWQADTGMAVDEYLDLFDHQLSELLSEGDVPRYPTSVAATWGIAFERLGRESPAALQLLELCSFFGAEPIPFRLLKMGRYAPSLPAPLSTTVSDSIMRHRAVREIGRLALARVDPGRDTLLVHRLVQEVLRDRMTPEQRAQFRAGAHELLAAATPGNPDNDQTWELHEDLAPHVLPSGAIDSDQAETRKVVLDQVRYRYRRGDFEGGRALAAMARDRWIETLGPDDQQTLLVSQHLADALWWLGDIAEARELRQETLERMERVLGPDHELVLATANGLGADLRVSGLFEKARVHDEEVLARHRRVFGEDDPNTLRSANNLAADLRLLGDFPAAYELDQDIYDRRDRTLRDTDSDLLGSIACLARDLLGLGDYNDARARLERPLVEFRGVLGPSHNEVLRAARTYALVLRKAGAYDESRAVAEANLDVHQAKFGELHLETLAAMTCACNDRRVTGDLDAARALGERTIVGYETILGSGHPFTWVSMVNQAIVLRLSGELAAAKVANQQALAGLLETMGPDNRFTLCCKGNLASDLAASGDHDGALHLSRELADQSLVVRGAQHSFTLGTSLNLVLDLRAIGEQEAADALQAKTIDRFVRVLGTEHPETVAATRGLRVDFDIEPPNL